MLRASWRVPPPGGRGLSWLSSRPAAFRRAACAFASVHVPSRPTDKRFVGFDRAGHFVDAAGVHRVADAVKHEPCRGLSHFQITGNLVRANTVLAVGNEPHGTEPLIESHGESSKIVPTLTENCFWQSRHFHMSRVLRKESLLDSQRGHAGPLEPHLAPATTLRQTSGSEKVRIASIKLLG